MAVTETISIDGQEVTFRASAAVPRLYRVKFHRDIYKDLSETIIGEDEACKTEDHRDHKEEKSGQPEVEEGQDREQEGDWL